ncbi:protein NRT1/ PTR FAMILY 5.10-like [Zingiber officinale]|uniref:Uncharacterized protein n=1 Tax=Zingiber officinale TaxID=94328 RepID=A0A8J5LTW6_ZINOF|nr:protein NRT1/ PTR FAMILY 5.10-like [Zingiber officinale]KAG6530178.1 hypothetical protein ZIOFF_012400 [Zingiber officinale]
MDDGALLLPHGSSDIVDGVFDYAGRPASRSATGRWISAAFIIWVEIGERFSYYGVSSNLISYLTGPLRESTATAAAAVNVWSGVASMLPLLGAFIADSYFGRYRTIVGASLLYMLGLSLMTLSSLHSSPCGEAATTDPADCAPAPGQVVSFYASLYLMALAQGCHKPCVQAFGADQFDDDHPAERAAKSSFFNWWYFGLIAGVLVANLLLTYIQDYVSWALGFGIPCLAMAAALLVFLLGTKTYRLYPLYTNSSTKCPGDGRRGDLKRLLPLLPIWATSLPYAVVFSQSPTLFTKQGATLDRRLGPNFELPAASLQVCSSVAIITFVVVYDRLLVPLARRLTKRPSGITMLQRIGTGMFISLLSIVVSALVEIKRLEVARESDDGVAPMSMWWLVPQYALFGVADVFTMIGLQEFFYDQVPEAYRSLGLGLYLSIFGVGSLLSGGLVSAIDKISKMGGGDSWFADDINRGHFDYFYWLLAGLSGVGLVLFLNFAKAYVYKK